MLFQNCLLTVNASTKVQEQNSSVLLKQLWSVHPKQWCRKWQCVLYTVYCSTL